MQPCQCCIHVLYSTLEFDVILGRVVNIVDPPHREDICINDLVYVYIDWNNFHIVNTDMLYSIIVDFENVFKIKHNKHSLPMMLPYLKYGCIAFQSLSLLKRRDINIDIYSPFNIFYLLKKMFPVKDTQLRWHNIFEKCTVYDTKPEDMRIIITPKSWQIDYNGQQFQYKLDETSIFGIFGRNNLERLFDYVINEFSFANIYYTRMIDVPDLKESHTRFFHIIQFSE